MDEGLDTRIAIALAHTNDSRLLSNKERESKIIELGFRAGIKFTFTGHYLDEVRA